jgi:hypothetical protein
MAATVTIATYFAYYVILIFNISSSHFSLHITTVCFSVYLDISITTLQAPKNYARQTHNFLTV